jgi:hypothetical protein
MKRILLVSSNRLAVSSELAQSADYGLDYQKIGTVFDSRQLTGFLSSKGPERFRELNCVLSNRHRGLLPRGKADCSHKCLSSTVYFKSYVCIIKTKLMHYLSSVYLIN